MEMERGFKGVWIPKDIWLSKNLTLQEKVFLVEISSLDNSEGCFASNSYFADFFGLSKNRCSEIIGSLEKKGFITSKIIREPGKNSIGKRVIKVFGKPKGGYSENRRGYSENWEYNNTVNNTSNTYVLAEDEKDLSRFGIYHTIDEAIDAMKSDQNWKAMYGKQAGVGSIADCDYWIDKYRDHAIASGKTSTSVKDLKSHCLNWTRKRIQSGDKVPRKMTEEEKRIARSKHFMTN